MPPRSAKIPSYRRHKARNLAVVSLGGRDVYLRPYGSKASRDEYDRVVGEWLAAGRIAPHVRQAAALSVTELVNAFRKSGTMPDSHADAYKAVMTIMVRLYGRTDAQAFGPLALKVVRERRVAAGWKRQTINQRVHHARRIFRWGIAHQMVTADVAIALAALKPLKRGKTTAPEAKPIKPVAVEHVEACIPFMTPTVATMVRLQMLTGMRCRVASQTKCHGHADNTPRLGSHLKNRCTPCAR
ncbi:MAG: hypothetical protein ACTHLZ_02040 [Tepidisphaeraceae bacterium]